MSKGGLDEGQLYEEALNRWGHPAQQDMMVEEMAELTVALAKHRRMPCFDRLKYVCEEIADVEIMLMQLKIMLEIEPGYFNMFKEKKLERLAERMGVEFNGRYIMQSDYFQRRTFQ